MGVVKTYLDKQNITHYASTNKNNTSIIERFHQNVWNYLKKSMRITQSLSFIKDIPVLINQYNNTHHASHSFKPADVFKHDLLVNTFVKTRKSKFKIGDFVRKYNMQRDNGFQKKSFEASYSDTVYQITGRVGNRYKLTNINTNHELVQPYLERQLRKTTPTTKSSVVPKKIVKLNKENTTARRNKKDGALRKERSEARATVPKNRKRVAKKPIRFRGDGISFFDI